MPRSKGPPSPEEVAALRALAAMGAARDFVAASTSDVAARLGTSQQTASRRVLALVERGLVQRKLGARRPLLKLSPEGLAVLRRELDALRRALGEGPARLEIRGKVATGMGEGAYYLSRRGYRDAFARLLGFDAFPGTLNVALDAAEAQKLATLGAEPGLLVAEFEDEGRTFGAVKCFPASLGGVDGAVVMPARGHHRDVLEVIAPARLRDKLGLRDGDEVLVQVTLR
ncbi:MAG TPA: DUF120 domain-containing protein [Candidatus Thermoplasmatota archaeon]|jgi:riboflavin kinase|nr:DUF120 domain-containing protein [Candidatus Thermoplasmatota archaeon]